MRRQDRERRSAARATRVAGWVLAATMIAGVASATDDLLELSLEDLMEVEVTSVSKKAEVRREAAAAITVLSAEDLRRSGLTSVPEALRLVPGVQVSRIDASRWAISIRGFQQEFSNKLLVLLDGRSLYTPLFGGIVWNEHNVSIDEIERIEIVRGPGGTLWGANAVNGVINIISKKAADTQGARAYALGGSQEYGGGARYGGRVGDDVHYRFSVRGERTEDFDFDQNYNANDAFTQYRVAFRSDAELGNDRSLSVHADYFDLDLERGVGVASPAPPFPITSFSTVDQQQRGGSVMLRFAQALDDGSRFEAKTYYDRVHRRTVIREDSHTVDVDLLYDRSLTERLGMVVGGNYRFWTTHTRPNGRNVALSPDDEAFNLASGFMQLKLDLLDDRLSLIAGTKLSYNNWSGFEYQPSGRFIVTPVEGHAVWGAISRAVRTPTLIDRDLTGAIGPVQVLGDRDFRSEDLFSLELGYRFFALEWIKADLSLFRNEYDDVSSVVGPPPVGPLVFQNPGEVEVFGGELEISLLPVDWLRITTGYAILDIDEDSPSSFISTPLEDTSPQHQFTLRTFLDLPAEFELDLALFYVDGLPGATPTLRSNNVTQYVRLDARLGWQPLDWLELALVGQNLTDARHPEFYDVQRDESSQIPRSGYAKVTVEF